MASNDSISGSGGNNATEYLLSELLAVVKDKIRGDDAQTDWDPITFAFTVPVGVFGILATIFALITIIQGILAASPGRRKSSRHVIGKWAKTRKTVFNWDELRTMTFVKTPILRAETLYQALLQTQKAMLQMETMEKEHTLHGRLRNMVPIVNRRDEGWFPWSKFQISYKKSSKESKEQTATRANWVKLLDYFDLDLIQFKNKDLQVTATDHIPDELRAVYAYTDVRTMIALGAVAEAMSLEPEMGSSYPILIGAEIQIDFRPHPVLGVVAAFSKYGTRQTQQHESQVKTTLLDARMKPWGNIQDNAPTFISRHRVNNSSNTKNKDQTIRRQVMFALKHSNVEVEYVPPASNNQSLGLGAIKFINAIDDEGINGRSHMQHTPKQIIHGTEQHQQLCDGNRNTMCGCQSNWDRSGNHNLLWMFVAKVPSEAPVVFPSSCVAIRKSLTTLCLQSRFWSGERAQQSIKRLYSVPDAPIDWPESLRQFHSSVSGGIQNTYQDTILQVCLQFLHSQNESLSRDQRINYNTMKDLIKNIDSWLATVPRSVLGCRKANLFLTTLILREVSCGIADGSFKVSTANPDVSGPMQGVVSANGTMMQGHLNDLKQLDLYLSKGIRTCLDEMPGNFFIMTFDVPSLVELEAGACPDAIVIFQRLQDVLGQCADVAKDAEKQSQFSAGRHQRSAFEVIDDMIIWRTILIGILFCSAPDNSKMYQSAVWNHVIPLL